MTPTRSPTILLVDDEEDILDGLKALFERHFDGSRILTARSGTQGLEILDRQAVDVVVSDFKMPGMSGLEFLSTAAVRQPKTHRVLMTAYDVSPQSRLFATATVEALFRKPLELPRMIARIRSFLTSAN